MKTLYLPNKKHEGMLVYCSKCKQHFSTTCKSKNNDGSIVEPKCGEMNDKIAKCAFPEKQKFKTRVHVANGVPKKSKTFDTREYDEAVVQAIAFKKEIKEKIKGGQSIKEVKKKAEKAVKYLYEFEIMYLNFLDNIGVPDHKIVERSDKHKKDVAKALTQLNEALKKHNIDYRIFPFDRLSDVHVGIYSHLFLRIYGL